LRLLSDRMGQNFDEEFARTLCDHAERLLGGVALVGCLRVIGHALAWEVPNPGRPAISSRARSVHRGLEALVGYANLVADDAHAHLFAAERLAIPDERRMRGLLIEHRQRLVTNGVRLLLAAAAYALR